MYLRFKITPDNQQHDLSEHIDTIYSCFKTTGLPPTTQQYVMAPVHKNGVSFYDAIVRIDDYLPNNRRGDIDSFISNMQRDLLYNVGNGRQYSIHYKTLPDDTQNEINKIDKMEDELFQLPNAKMFPDPNTNVMAAITYPHRVSTDSPMFNRIN